MDYGRHIGVDLVHSAAQFVRVGPTPREQGDYRVMWLNRVLLVGVIVALSLPSRLYSQTPDAEMALPLQKVGEAKLKVMFWDVYHSTLYAPGGRYESGVRPLRLQIRYLRDIKAKDLVKQTGKEWVAQGREHPNTEAWLARLTQLWPNVAEDDVITLDIDGQGASHFRHNNVSLGSIADPAFGELFSGIWLAEDTTRPVLRATLLGI